MEKKDWGHDRKITNEDLQVGGISYTDSLY